MRNILKFKMKMKKINNIDDCINIFLIDIINI